jgi:DNA polymerase-3 subunit alpha
LNISLDPLLSAMSQKFCHIHNHTEYSLLDGANRIPQMVSRAKELGMESLAITDHGVMFGVMEFYLECKKQGIKPLLGVEAYIAPQGLDKKVGSEEKSAYHMVLLAKDLDGYRNLCKLSTVAALEGYYRWPRIDHELLRKHSKGLIGTSACLGSEVCQELLNGNYEKAQYIAGMYAEMFGEGNYFIELQDHRLPEQAQIRDSLLRISRELKLPLVATNDAHYLCKEDHSPHDVLLCIQTGRLVDDASRMRFQTEEFYLKSPEEMEAIFHETPDALENSVGIADLCDVELDKQRAPMPQPDVPDGLTSFEYLRQLAEKGLLDRSKAPEAALERLNYELAVIEKTGFQDYFLLVKEFAQATRDRGIYFGVRGSAAGSLVSYCVGITDVDPVEHDLTFERFLNPERISMPDIDMDFEDARRDEIIQYVTDRFGADHVAQIVTFGTLGPKAALKDCARVKGWPPQDADKLCKTIPNLPGWTLEKAYKEIAEFRDLVDGSQRTQELFSTAKQVEGIARHAGVHAAGVVISKEPLVDYVPLYRGSDGQPITAYDMGILEKIGLLKMDFLGLSNLTVLAKSVENIRRTRGEEVDIRSLPEDDQKTFDMLGRGETTGVFQLEGGGMTRWVVQLKPNSVKELAAMIALYRPGPMQHIPRFIDTKFGRQEAKYLHELMRPILEDTYGVIVYQDQVLKIVQALAGFTLGKADVLRRAMGKKDASEMAKMKAEFVSGAAEKGVDAKTCETIWKELEPFAGYAFNKAHAVCYSILAYQTAYLKANYAIEYMAALLAAYRDKEDRVISCIEECRRQKIHVLPPDINRSERDFSIESGQAIRFGLAAIKGVGEGVVDELIKERAENGPFKHLFEFCERVKPFGVNRTAVEALIKAGALDGIDRNRRKLLDRVDGALQFADSANRDRLSGQDSLFGEGEGPMVLEYPELPDCEMPTRNQNLSWEKEVMGIYVSDHPLRGYERSLRKAAQHSCINVEEMEEGTSVSLAGVIANIRIIVTKSKGERMATLTLEDFSGQASIICFPATYAKFKDTLVKDQLVALSGAIMIRERGSERSVELRLENVQPLEPELDFQTENGSQHGTVSLRMNRATRSQLTQLFQIIDENPGSLEVMIEIEPSDKIPPIFPGKVMEPSKTFMEKARSIVPGLSVEIRRSEPSPYMFTEEYREPATVS